MIRISLGNVGSGKTANEVREMYINKSRRINFSNIKTNIKTNVPLDTSMIIKKKLHKTIKRKSGKTENVYDYKLNIEFWKNLTAPINVILDEAHTIINARRALSKTNILINDWISLIRRILGQTEDGEGELVLISQLPRRLDPISRDMATQVRYHVCHYIKTCKSCNFSWQENSEMPEKLFKCPSCNKSNSIKHSHKIEIWHFKDMKNFEIWKDWGQNSYYKHYIVNDIEKYFGLYDTLQWDNMFSNLY